MVVRWLPAAVLVLTQVVALREQKFATEPQDQTAVVGHRATLSCRVINKSGLLQWTKDDFGLGDLTGFNRYSIVGNVDEGEYSLDIYPVMVDDDAIYRCQVGAGIDGEAPIRSRPVNLTVLIPPEYPKIIQGSHLITTEDREIELECVSTKGKPAAEITWIDGKGNVLRKGVEYIVEPLLDQKTFTAKSILKLVAKMEHHNTTFTCQAQNLAEQSYHSARLRLEVKFAPKVHLVTVSNASRLVEGQNVRMICSVVANPSEVSYRWYFNEQLVLGDPTTELVLRNVSQVNHNSVVRCEVTNAVGKSYDSQVLNISYGPRFRIKPYSVQADLGAMVTLMCDVDGNPPPNIVWIHEDSDRRGNVLTFTWEQVVSTAPNLTLTVAQDTAGHYYCRASVPGFPDIGAEATVYMKGPPTIISHRTQYGVPGDNVRLECSAFSIPTPQRVVWSFRGEDVGADLDYSVLEDQLTEGIKSTLIIQESRQEHFGVYNCTVSNPYGSDVVEIILKAQKSFPLHTTLIGVMGVIVMIVVLSSILLLYQCKDKHSNKIDKGEMTNSAKKTKESDISSNLSDLKLEIEYSGSESGSEGGGCKARPGLPLAGPVPLDHRYSQCYSDTDFPPKSDGHNNNGYVPYGNYSRDYNPPAALPSGVSPVPGRDPDTIDPRYSAVYGNPYLRHTIDSQLPPPTGPVAPFPSSHYAAVMRNRATKPAPRPTSQALNNRSSLATHV